MWPREATVPAKARGVEASAAFIDLGEDTDNIHGFKEQPLDQRSCLYIM